MEGSKMELWGGVECTINRVRGQYFNQLERSGHCARLTDLAEFARLGIRRLRVPVLWEAVAPDSPREMDWSWPDQCLATLRQLGISPIVGLVHHGSGPHYTDLLDQRFPEKLAEFARRVAERYPWVDAFTPINEPMTTARFSGLYGLWYPHLRDESAFLRILLNECRATAAAMAAIREINPGALLIQTEDLGRAYSRPKLRYQAEFENERRWLGWDLLAGRVRPGHKLWNHLQQSGVSHEQLEACAGAPCPPDILGINYYVTSERYLDERLSLYPSELYGGNGIHRYADDAAVRARSIGIGGFRSVIAEAAQRYHLPIALTEVHLGCAIDEQVRWFAEAWQDARVMRARGVDVRAVTAWALLGSYDWDSLVTRSASHYEPGVFDIRDGELKTTALAEALRALASTGEFEQPMLQEPGWWRRRSRLRHVRAETIAA